MPDPPPQDPAEQLEWLVDRAAIGDLLTGFAHAIDSRDQSAYAASFTDDGVLVLPFGSFEGRDAILAMPNPPPAWATHHLSANHRITIDGDTASARAYVIATHVFDATEPGSNAHAGGWYDYDLRRTAEGWRFSRCELAIRWTDGDMIPGGRQERAGPTRPGAEPREGTR